MSYLSRETMQQIHDLDILKVATKLGIKYSDKGAFRMCKCFMHDDKHPSMWFKIKNNTWSCPVCSKGGGVVSLVREHENLTYREALDWLIREFNIYVYNDSDKYRPLKSCSNKKRQNISYHHESSNQKSMNPVISTLDIELLSKCHSTNSTFCRSLVSTGILTEEQMLHAAEVYHLGQTAYGGVIFWNVDQNQQVHEGKIMWYKKDCHRDHNQNPSTVSSRLIRRGQLPKDWKAERCLFGLHQLADAKVYGSEFMVYGDSPDNTSINHKPSARLEETLAKARTINHQESIIAIVESEKTAIICSELIPSLSWQSSINHTLGISERSDAFIAHAEKEPDSINHKPAPINHKPDSINLPVIWMATGGKSNLTAQVLQPIIGKRVILFPDTDTTGDTYSEWQNIAKEINKSIPKTIGEGRGTIYISNLLELHATEDQKKRKIDIADFIIESKG